MDGDSVDKKLRSALDLLQEIKERQKAPELRFKVVDKELYLIDYREQLRRFDVFAAGFNKVLYFDKSNTVYKDKLAAIIDALDRMKPVRAVVSLRVDTVLWTGGKEVEVTSGIVVDIKEHEVFEDRLKAPVYIGRGLLGMTRTGKPRIRVDSDVYIIDDTTRNGQRILSYDIQEELDVLFSYSRVRNSAGYSVIEGVFVVPVAEVEAAIAEQQMGSVEEIAERAGIIVLKDEGEEESGSG